VPSAFLLAPATPFPSRQPLSRPASGSDFEIGTNLNPIEKKDSAEVLIGSFHLLIAHHGPSIKTEKQQPIPRP